MKLVVISNETFFDGEADVVNQLFEEGMEHFHLRKPMANADDTERFLNSISASYYSKVSLHHHHILADSYLLKGIHLNVESRRNSAESQLEKWLNRGCFLSTSAHSLSEINSLESVYSYSFLSPVFDSISKANYKGFSDQSFSLLKLNRPVKIIALGGITDSNIHLVKTMNFDGAAVLGYLWSNPSRAVENFKKLIELC